MGHCDEFGYMLWATAATLVMHYGPLPQIWLCVAGHYGRCGYTLWVIVWNEVVQEKALTTSMLWPYHKIWLSTMGHNAVLDYMLWAIA